MSFHRSVRRPVDVRRRLFLEPLENRQLMAIDMAVVLRITDATQTIEQAGNDIMEIDLNGQFQIRGDVQDLRAGGIGVFQAYFDVNHVANAGTPAAAIISGNFPVDPQTGTNNPLEITNVGGSGNTNATTEVQKLFLIPVTASTAGIFTYTPELTDDQTLFPTGLRLNDPVDASELAVTGDTVTVLPLTDAIPDPAAVNEDAAAVNVPLTGIAGGVGAQVLVEAAPADANLVDVTVVYTSGDATGTVVVTPKPNAFGATLITVNTTVNGAVRTRTFNFTVNSVLDAAVIGLPVGEDTITYVENATPTFVAPNATVSDGDSPANFNGGSLNGAITANAGLADVLVVASQGPGVGEIEVVGNEVRFGGTAIGTYNVTSLSFVVDFNTNATPAAVQALVRRITFAVGGEAPSTTPRTLTLTLDDGTAATPSVTTITANVNAVNDAPTITLPAGPVAYAENDPPVIIAAGATVGDVDSANFDTGSLTIAVTTGNDAADELAVRNQGVAPGEIGVGGGNVTFGGVIIGTVTGGNAGTPLVISLNASATPAIVQALAANITYQSTSQTPLASKTVRFTIDDGDLVNATAFAEIPIALQSVLDAPIVTLAPMASYTENDPALVLDPTATITDADSANFAGGTFTVSYTTGGEATDLLEIRNEGILAGQIGVSGQDITFGNLLIGTFTGGGATNLVVTLNAAATPTAVQALARNITFRSTSDRPLTAKSFTFALTDDTNETGSDTIDLTVVQQNDLPTISVTPDTLNYPSSGPATLIAPTTTIADPDSDGTTGAISFLTIATSVGGTADDRLEIRNEGTGVGQVSVAGNTISYNFGAGAVAVGTFVGGVGTTPLVVTFTAPVAPEVAQAVARNVTFRNVVAQGAASARTVDFTVTDSATATAVDSATINLAVSNNPVLTFPGAPADYIENDPATLLDPGATVTDPDSADFDGGSLTATISAGIDVGDVLAVRNVGVNAGEIGVNGVNITFGGVVIGTFIGGTAGTPLIISFNAAATQAAVQALAQNLTFASTADAPTLVKTIDFALADGDGGTVTTPLTLNVQAENDDPILVLLPATAPTFNEGDAPVAIAPASTVVDPDSADFDAGALSVELTANGEATDVLSIANVGVAAGEIGFNGTEVTFGGVVFGTVVGGTNGAALTITFDADATPAAVQALVQNITFSNSSNVPSIAVRTATFTLTDGDTGNTNDTADINVGALNDNPELVLLPAGPVTFTEEDPAVLLAAAATVDDIDSANFDTGTLTVTITTNGEATDVLAIRNQGTNAGEIGVSAGVVTFGNVNIGTVTGGTNGVPLTINFNTAAATPEATQALVRNITFLNSSQNPSTAARTVEFTLTDGDNGTITAPRTVNVIAQNDPPVVTLSSEPITITVGVPTRRITSSPTVTDVDSANFDGGTLTVSITANGTANDVLEILNQGTGSGEIGVSGANVTFGGVVIGTFAFTAGNAAALVVTFDADATPAAVRALVGNIFYRHLSPTPEAARTVQFVLTDGDNGTSTPVTKQITIVGTNAPPVITLPSGDFTYTENDPPVEIDSAATITDDGANFDGGFLTVEVVTNASADDRLVVTPVGNVTVSGSDVLVSGVVIGTIQPGADGVGTNALTLALGLNSTPAAVQAILRAITFSNVSEDPSELQRTVRVTVDDGGGASDSADRLIAVVEENDAPVITTIATANYTENAAAVIIDPNAVVTDVDSTFAGGSLTVTITAGADADDDLAINNQGAGAGLIGVTGSDVTFGGVTIGSFTGGVGTTALVVTFNANVTPAAVQALVRNITYHSDAVNPAAGKEVTFLVNDGETGTDTSVTAITITAQNDGPVVTTAVSVNYTENGDAIVIDPAATVTDPDSTDFAGGTLTAAFTVGGAADDILAIRNVGSGVGQIDTDVANVRFGGVIIGTFAGGTNGTSLVVTLNAAATPTAVQALLRNITYRSTSESTPLALKTVAFTITDGDNGTGTDTTDINLTAVNDAPDIVTATPINYAVGSAAVVIDPAATVIDPDETNFDTGTLKAEVVTGGDADDELVIRNQGTTAGLVGVSGANITFGGVLVGSFTGGTASTPLLITFNADANQAAVQAVLRNITFFNDAAAPIATKVVRFTITDGDTGTDQSDTTINVTAVNVAPVLTLSQEAVSYTEDAAGVIIAGTSTLVDNDSADFNGGSLTVTTTGNAAAEDALEINEEGSGAGQIGLVGSNVTFGGVTIGTVAGGTGSNPLVITFNAASTRAAVEALVRNITFQTNSQTPSTLTRTITFTVNDGDGGSDTKTKDVTVVAVNDAPVANLPGAAVSYTVGAAAVVLDATATVTDVDSLNFDTGSLTVSLPTGGQAGDTLAIRNEGTATGQIGVSGGNVTFSGVVIGGFTGGTDGSALVITFDADATPAAVQALYRNIVFSTTATTPTTPKTARFLLNDGDGGGTATDTDDKTINVSAVAQNQNPVQTLPGGPVAYTENGAAILIDAGATVTDSDSLNFDTGTLTVSLPIGAEAGDVLAIRNEGTASTQIGVSGTSVTFGGLAIGTFTGGTGTTALVITFNANASPAAVQALERNITFRSDSDTSTATKTVRFVLTDGDGGTDTDEKAINVTAVNDNPVQTLSTETITYSGTTVTISATGTVTDVDSLNFDGGTLAVSFFANGTADDRLLILNQGTGSGQIGVSGSTITFSGTAIGTFTGGTGTTQLLITFNSAATPAAVQALERAIQFSNVSATPTANARTVRFALSDGDGGTDSDDKTVTVNAAANNAPVITLSTETVTYTENGTAVVIAATSTVTDTNSTNFDTGILTVTITSGGEATDRIEIKSDGTAANQIGVSGSTITFGGVNIGTFTGGTGTTPLAITLNANATPAATQALVRNLTFRSTSEAPSTVTRTIQMMLSDGDGQTSLPSSKNVTVVAINDAPVNTVPATQSGATNTAVVFSAGNNNLISVSDVDLGTAELSVTISVTNGTLSLSGITGLTFTTGDGTADATMTFRGTTANINAALNGLSFTPTTGFTGDAAITLVTSDQGATGTGGTLTDTDSVTIKVGNANFAGGVFVDVNNNGVRDNGELGIPNVVITLTGIDSGTTGVTRTVTTGADGTFSVAGLTPGQYRVTQTQPDNFLNGTTTGPTGSTVDDQGVIITVAAGQVVDNVSFGELGLVPIKITLQLFLSSTPSDQEVINQFAPGGSQALRLAGGAKSGGNVTWLASPFAQKTVTAAANQILTAATKRVAAAVTPVTTKTPTLSSYLSRSSSPKSLIASGNTSAALQKLQTELAKVQVKVADLPGDLLAQTDGSTITFDVDAAGQGWFQDETPNDNEEFFAQMGQLQAANGQAAGKIDLLTVAAHELGHILGLDDLYTASHDHDLMSDDLVPGVRKNVDDVVDALFGKE